MRGRFRAPYFASRAIPPVLADAVLKPFSSLFVEKLLCWRILIPSVSAAMDMLFCVLLVAESQVGAAMKEIAPQKKLFRCVMAAALAVGLSLPSTGVFAYGNPEDATFDSLEVDDKVLGGLDAATDEEALPIEPAEGGEGQPSADGAPTPEESLDSEASDIVTGGASPSLTRSSRRTPMN